VAVNPADNALQQETTELLDPEVKVQPAASQYRDLNPLFLYGKSLICSREI
jgi:hypothetical protein